MRLRRHSALLTNRELGYSKLYLYMLPCFVVGGKVAHPKWWVLTLCCTWLHSTQWNESCNLTHRQDKTSQIMNENTGPARNTVAGPIFFLVSSLAGFFSRQRERCLPGGGGGAGSQECHELISTPSHISYWKWRRVYSSYLFRLFRLFYNQQRQADWSG